LHRDEPGFGIPTVGPATVTQEVAVGISVPDQASRDVGLECETERIGPAV
jgi:hypothetical protein